MGLRFAGSCGPRGGGWQHGRGNSHKLSHCAAAGRSQSRRIQILTVLTRRYNAHPPSHPVERVPAQDELAYRSHKSSTNRCAKGRRRVRLSAICGGWHTWNPSDPHRPTKSIGTYSMFTAREGGSQGGRTKKHRPSDLQDAGPSTGNAPTDAGQLRDARPSTRTYGCASRQAQICGGATPTRRFGKCCPHAGNTNPCHHEFGH